MSIPSGAASRSHLTRLPGLADRPRPGRPAGFSPGQVEEVKALSCEQPAGSDVPRARWSRLDLAVEAARRRVVASVSTKTARRWLAADAIKTLVPAPLRRSRKQSAPRYIRPG